MTVIPSRKDSAIHAYKLSDEEMLGIGGVVRACAEIEQIVDLYLYELARIAPWQGHLLLGKMSLSSRINLAKSFAKANEEAAVQLHVEAFETSNFRALITFRNTVAHGILLGKTDNGSIAFLVQETERIDEGVINLRVRAYKPDAFTKFAGLANNLVGELEEGLQLRSSRDKYRAQYLRRSARADRRPQSAKRQSRPESSSE